MSFRTIYFIYDVRRLVTERQSMYLIIKRANLLTRDIRSKLPIYGSTDI